MSSIPEFNGDQTIRAGAICTVANGDGKFGAIKVLQVTNIFLEVTIYKNKYDERPAMPDLDSLTIGTVHDPDGFGIGHVALSPDGFMSWEPVVVGFREITAEEEEWLD